MTPAAYARFSTDKQQASSADDQLRAIRAYCQRMGWPAPIEYRDEAISGSMPLASRPGAAALLADAVANRFDVVIMEALDRFSRDLPEQERVVRRLEFLDIRIVGLGDGYDSGMGMRKINRLARGMVNEMYLDDLRHKTHRGLSGQVARGYIATGPSYGYKIVRDDHGSKFEIDPDASKWVLWIFEQFAAGWSCQKIASELNRMQVASPRKNVWRQSALFGSPRKGTGILNNELYVGRYIWNRSQWIKDPDTGKRTRRDRPESEWQRQEQPELRIVPDEVWSAVRDRMGRDRHSDGSKGVGRRPTTLFGGMLRCSHCGGAMVAVSATQYGCATRKDAGVHVCPGILVDRQKADKRLLAEVRDMLLSPESIIELQREIKRLIEIETRGDDRKSAATRLAAVNAEIGRIVDALATVGVSAALTDRLKQAETEKQALQRITQAASTAPQVATVSEIAAGYRQLVLDLESALKSDVVEAREILRELLGPILVRPEGREVWADLKQNAAQAFAVSGISTMVVAGTGFEPVTFGL
jgi:site-specific DNA recombinase